MFMTHVGHMYLIQPCDHMILSSSVRYETMCMCWALEPSKRPSFSKLVSFMCNQLTDSEEKVRPCSRPEFKSFSFLYEKRI